MNDKEFYWFCRILKRSTTLTLTLLMLAVILIPFAILMTDQKPWYGLSGFVVFVIIYFGIISKDKDKFMKGEKVDLGIYGSASVEYPLWQNILFWFFYLLMEIAVIVGVIGIFAKAIWPS